MAKTVRQAPVLNTYRIIDPRVPKMLGPHKVFQSGDERVVRITDKQAKFYLTQGAIEPAE